VPAEYQEPPLFQGRSPSGGPGEFSFYANALIEQIIASKRALACWQQLRTPRGLPSRADIPGLIF